jgi:hypothetical protein
LTVRSNAVSESWFGTYKLEMIEGRSWPTIARLRSATFRLDRGLTTALELCAVPALEK